MALKTLVKITLDVAGDGSSTVMNIDLLKHPYIVWGINDDNDVVGPKTVNWFTDTPAGKRPDGLLDFTQSSGPDITVTLSGTILTVTFSSPPEADPATTQISIFLTFSGD